jgi:hypothetical protein
VSVGNAYLLDAVLNRAWAEAQADGSTLLEKLREYQRTALARVEAGALTSLSGVNRSAQFVSGNVADVTPTDFLNAVSELIQRYGRLLIDNPSFTDADFVTAFNAGEFLPVTRFRPDFSCSRY